MDKLSPEVLAVERDIDTAYKDNLLMDLPFAVAAWYVLAYVEDGMLKQQQGRQQVRATAKNNHTALKYALQWLRQACKEGGVIPNSYIEKYYLAAHDLIELAANYSNFVTAYTYASRGLMTLDVNGNQLTHNYTDSGNLVYEAYGRFVGSTGPEDIPQETTELTQLIRNRTNVVGTSFSINITPRLVALAMSALTPWINHYFSLPDNWRFSRYTIAEFKQVYLGIAALASIHLLARMNTVRRRIKGMGFDNALLMVGKKELLLRLVRYSGLGSATIQAVIEDLTFGARNIRKPDPALQPLIALTSEKYVIAPQLWLNSAPERNLTVLLNKIPEERNIYSRLVDQKETVMRERILMALNGRYRIIWGRIAGRNDLPDVDIAIIDDKERVCLLGELKWFIGPDEAREVIERTADLKKGVAQATILSNAFETNESGLLDLLKIDSLYKTVPLVVSANWIGHVDVQNDDVPIIQEGHLLKKIGESTNIAEVVTWLMNRKYLPVEQVHYRTHMITSQIGSYTLSWGAIEPLISDELLPS